MTLISELHQQWSNDPEYQAAYKAQRFEFEIEKCYYCCPFSG